MRGKFPQIVAAKGERALRQAVSRRRADRARAADDHVADGGGGFAKIFRGDDFEFVREQSLFDEQNGISRAIKGDGAKMSRASANGDVHFFLERLNVQFAGDGSLTLQHISIQRTLIFIRRIFS